MPPSDSKPQGLRASSPKGGSGTVPSVPGRHCQGGRRMPVELKVRNLAIMETLSLSF
ncbi:MAG: hypothetical protein LBQ12_14285 [Deltaproteobacteria bacterium]|nr:hypothetical protein [Deltaproteobacteria bacterium]